MSNPTTYHTLFFLFCFLTGIAQTRIESEHLTIEDGLSQGYVSSIVQDQEGFLWIGTKDGLNRYDGKHFEIFRHDPKSPYSISNNWVSVICEKGDFLVIGTHSEYLNILHKRTKRCYRIPLKVKDLDSFSQIYQIHQDEDGVFWISTLNKISQLKVIFPKGFWEQLPTNTELLEEVQVELMLDGVGHYWDLDKEKLIVIDTPQIKQYKVADHKVTSLPENAPYVQFPLFKKITPKLGLGSVDLPYTTAPFRLYKLGDAGWQAIHSELNFYWQYFYDPTSNLIWLQHFDNNRLMGFDPKLVWQSDRLTEQDAKYVIDDVKARAISFYRDRSGILWIGTVGFGLVKVSPRKVAIKTYLTEESIYNGIFSSEGGEFWYFKVGSPRYYHGGPHQYLNKASQYIHSLNPTQVDWVSESDGKGWMVVANKVRDQTSIDLMLYSVSQGAIREETQVRLSDFWEDSELGMLKSINQQLYILYSNYLVQYDPLTQEKQVHQFDLFKDQIPTILHFAQTQNGHFWIGTSSGLIQGKPDGAGVNFEVVEELNHSICASLLVDPTDRNVLWIGTKGRGLYRLDTQTMQFKILNADNGLPNEVIYGVLNDDQGNLWMSSNRGIIRYTPKNGRIRNFTKEDGMQSDEFNTYAFGKSPNGELLFGGIHGLNIFHPDDLKDNPFTPEVRITGLEVNNQVVAPSDSSDILTESIEYTNELVLPFHQNNFTLSFAGLEYSAPGKNTYAFYLEGAEAKWAHTTTDNRAPYLNLAPGKYSFKIKAANGDGIWSESVRSLGITILPPWYRSKLAYSIYLLSIGLLLWWLNRFQQKRLTLKHQLDLEQKEAERLKELDAFRSRFYTNITHEFRTPLTVIMGIANQLHDGLKLAQPLRNKLGLIVRNSDNLLNLVNHMLDLSKIEHQALKINYEQGEILSYLRYLMESFTSIANVHNVQLKLESNQSAIWMDYDAEKIRQIFSNLLSNAIKHSPSEAWVVIKAEAFEDQFQLAIMDAGSGIPANALPHIFERFYRVDDPGIQGPGSGIGLALTKELVQLLDGDIAVDSQLGQGTTFRVFLPIKRRAPIKDPELISITPDSSLRSNRSLADLKSRPRILIIEDNADLIAYLSTILNGNYQLSFAYNGAIGIEKALELVPDIIISDVMMPEKTGFEVTQTLKNDDRTSHIPIILLTAKVDFASRLTGIKRGADVYLAKPFQPEELSAQLESLLLLRQKLQAKYAKVALEDGPTAKIAENDQEKRFLDQLRVCIEANLDNVDLNAAKIAKQVGMSRSNLYAKLSAITGMSFNVYVRTLRLNRAKELLKTTDLNVSQIAYEVGFKNPNYFTNQFTKQFGIAPSKMRN